MASRNGTVQRHGHVKGADPPLVDLPLYERIRIMRREGWEQTFSTGRHIKLRTLEPDQLLKDGDIPDILTPLLLKSLYGNQRDEDVRQFLEEPFARKEDAFAYIELLNLIATKSIADDTQVEELTLAEKRLIFRFALGSSELLVSFAYTPPESEPEPDNSSAPQESDAS